IHLLLLDLLLFARDSPVWNKPEQPLHDEPLPDLDSDDAAGWMDLRSCGRALREKSGLPYRADGQLDLECAPALSGSQLKKRPCHGDDALPRPGIRFLLRWPLLGFRD